MPVVIAELISRAQVIAGHFGDFEPQALITEIRGLAADLPQCMSRADQLVLSEVLDQMLARFVRVAGLERQPDIANGFVMLMTSRPMLTRWRSQWLSVADRCAMLLGGCRSFDSATGDPRVTRMIECINARHADPRLNGRAVADAAQVSPWHAARLLKQQTGSGFLAHLHRRRIAAARDLLIETSFSIKEISTAVGYLHHSQLSRHFRDACGVTPHAFRSAHVISRQRVTK